MGRYYALDYTRITKFHARESLLDSLSPSSYKDTHPITKDNQNNSNTTKEHTYLHPHSHTHTHTPSQSYSNVHSHTTPMSYTTSTSNNSSSKLDLLSGTGSGSFLHKSTPINRSSDNKIITTIDTLPYKHSMSHIQTSIYSPANQAIQSIRTPLTPSYSVISQLHPISSLETKLPQSQSQPTAPVLTVPVSQLQRSPSLATTTDTLDVLNEIGDIANITLYNTGVYTNYIKNIDNMSEYINSNTRIQAHKNGYMVQKGKQATLYYIIILCSIVYI